MNSRFNTNTSKIYAFSFFQLFLVLLPVFVPFFQSRGLTMEEVFQLQAIFGLGVAVLEVPTGYLCDLWGRKNTLVAGGFFLGLGATFLHFAHSFWTLVIYELILSLAFSLMSGADISLLYDTHASQSRDGKKKSLAHLQFFSVSGEALAAILGGLFVTNDFRVLLNINSFVSWMPFLIALTLNEPHYKKMNARNHRENFTEVFQHLMEPKERSLRLAFVNLVIWSLSTFFAVWMIQKYWATQAVPLQEFGFLWAGFHFFVGIVGQQVHRIEKAWGQWPLLIMLSLAPPLGYFFNGSIRGRIWNCFVEFILPQPGNHSRRFERRIEPSYSSPISGHCAFPTKLFLSPGLRGFRSCRWIFDRSLGNDFHIK
jgi:MFS family permease